MSDKKKSDLGPRLLTALVAIPILLAIIFLTPPLGFSLLITAAGAVTVWEYCQMTFGQEHPGGARLTTALSAALILCVTLWPDQAGLMASGCFIVLYAYYLLFYKDQAASSAQMSHSIAALCYGALMFGCFALLRIAGGDAGPFWVVMCLAIIWGSDTGAYFAGRTLGKRKLYPAVSPNKSVEGAIGGLVASVLFAFGFDALFGAIIGRPIVWELGAWTVQLQWVQLDAWKLVVVAIPANLLGQTGDLVESLLKRAHGVKDSGAIFPGHGGMMDRIDALIFASPWLYAFVRFIA
jgi:phosphatidate cytidylyltransferase